MSHQISYTPAVSEAFDMMYLSAKENRNEFVTPEHLLLALLSQEEISSAVRDCGGNTADLVVKLQDYIAGLDRIPSHVDLTDYVATISSQLQQLISNAFESAVCADVDAISASHLLKGMLDLEESFAAFWLNSAIDYNIGEFFSYIISNYSRNSNPDNHPEISLAPDSGERHHMNAGGNGQTDCNWKRLVSCVNDDAAHRNPLVGRGAEMERTIQVLCRKDKNNPLHVGEPGVGKTALVYGLARLVEEGNVPDKLKGAKIYRLDLGNLIAGTQYRGDFERRIKDIMEGIATETNPIVYIDEIHSLVGAGATGESSLDASDMLKPFLEEGKIRFIGSTTYDEFKKYLARNKGIVRRFQQIDIAEPSVEETINILRQLKKGYEAYHGVYYSDKAIEFAAKGAAKHISGRFLPDKAIDLIDEAGAFRELHPLENHKRQTVDHKLISKVLARMCKVSNLEIDDAAPVSLMDIDRRIMSKIFGQDEAVRNVAEAVLIAKAGIEDDTRPLASLLFVGPTGVGKTEVAKVLAEELSVPLIRFDMSEYTEKHAVAKLIGSPAGYVGYDDGGLLTDAIRKTPDCVLLLDEIEKAHEDIYNILLQVMDYASLSDNKGNKADFRNVVIIMTSNAGAQFARLAKVGFANNISSGEAMMREVKKTFKPEFINRLSATVIFNEMNREMADMILDKKLAKLNERLSAKNVTMSISPEARDFIMEKAFSREYGAREIDRVISKMLKPLLMKEILFGVLKKGGVADISLNGDRLAIAR